jgi:outer membrane protein TolC
LELKQALDRTYADWLRLGERIGLYEKVVVQRAASNAEAALAGYQSQVSDFAELIRSRLDYLEIDLKLRRLEAERALAHSRLLFLAGESR